MKGINEILEVLYEQERIGFARFKAFQILSDAKLREADRYRQLLTDEEVVKESYAWPHALVLAIEAAVTVYPTSVHVLPIIVSEFDKGKRKFGAFAVALGLLKGLARFSWPRNEYYEKALPSALAYLVKCDDTINEETLKPFRGKLSKAVAEWVRPRENVGVRTAQVLEFLLLLQERFQKIDWRKKEAEEREGIFQVGALITDEVCYKLFGSISTHGRVLALNALADKHLSP